VWGHSDTVYCCVLTRTSYSFLPRPTCHLPHSFSFACNISIRDQPHGMFTATHRGTAQFRKRILHLLSVDTAGHVTTFPCLQHVELWHHYMRQLSSTCAMCALFVCPWPAAVPPNGAVTVSNDIWQNCVVLLQLRDGPESCVEHGEHVEVYAVREQHWLPHDNFFCVFTLEWFGMWGG